MKIPYKVCRVRSNLFTKASYTNILQKFKDIFLKKKNLILLSIISLFFFMKCFTDEVFYSYKMKEWLRRLSRIN